MAKIYIQPIDVTTTADQNELRNNSKERLLQVPECFRTGASILWIPYNAG